MLSWSQLVERESSLSTPSASSLVILTMRFVDSVNRCRNNVPE